MTAKEIELAISRHYNLRKFLVVPNIWWGVGLNHECDMFILTTAGYAYEIEIKISRSDLLKDLNKSHNHKSRKLKRLYFAVPEKLKDIALQIIPERSGLYIVTDNLNLTEVKPAVDQVGYKFTSDEKFNIVRLASMRIWPLKEKLYYMNKKNGLHKGKHNAN